MSTGVLAPGAISSSASPAVVAALANALYSSKVASGPGAAPRTAVTGVLPSICSSLLWTVPAGRRCAPTARRGHRCSGDVFPCPAPQHAAHRLLCDAEPFGRVSDWDVPVL